MSTFGKLWKILPKSGFVQIVENLGGSCGKVCMVEKEIVENRKLWKILEEVVEI